MSETRIGGIAAARIAACDVPRPAGGRFMGTALSADPRQFAALAAPLRAGMPSANFARMEAGAARLCAGLSKGMTRRKWPWPVLRIGLLDRFCLMPPFTT